MSKRSRAESDDSKPSSSKKSKSDYGEVESVTKGGIKIFKEMQPIPTKNAAGELIFPDYPNFKPNLTPKEVLHLGSFGGTYFRPIKSGVTGLSYKDAWKELPSDWLEGLNVRTQIASSTYDTSVNKFNASCGGSLDMWESSGWIMDCDPYGWFQWYCRFYQGRRTSDDERQVGRGLRVFGPTGRWRTNLQNKCIRSGLKPEDAYNKVSISPTIRQLLQVRLH
jgi:hypothetical protein